MKAGAPLLLQVQDLRLYFRTTRGAVQAVDGLSFALGHRQALAVLGESGCGKSSLARAILRLLPRNVHTYTGQVFLNGAELMSLNEDRFRREVRWSGISLVAQAAMNSLNPVIKVGEQVMEPLVTHRRLNREEARQRASKALQLVGVPVDFLDRYAFELSGGMRQRVVIAMALVADPPLIIMDEPTSALDVLTQANIMNVLKGIKKEVGSSFLLITHDVATSSELADRIAVMYAGQLVELGDAAGFFPGPLHPYSKKLMTSVPRLRGGSRPEFIPGQPPSLINPSAGCRFAPRCSFRFNRCQEDPPLVEVEPGQWVKCWLYPANSNAGSHAG
ncbi:MAG TPA: ABC transporter ATP-binding protein [Dehalococcoidia bacterium]|nr:ABC transporter ATP-binding protein [Dehalococcoidia bacterium]